MVTVYLRIKLIWLSLVYFLFEVALISVFLICRNSGILEGMLKPKTTPNAC